MKNFTKQNFKTNPLWIRLLIMAFMLLAGSSSAWAKKVYFTPNSNWKQSSAWFAVYSWGSQEQWVKLTAVNGETDLYEGTINDSYNNLIFCRMNNSTSSTGWNNVWNQTNDLTYPTDGNNKYTVTGSSWSNGTGTWSTYTPPCTTVTITWNNFDENMCINNTQNLSAAASHGTVSYTSSSTANAAISGTTLTAVKAGTSVITASVAASGNYCPASATKTVKVINCIPTGTVLYLKPGTNWAADNARFALYLFTDGLDNATWVSATPVCNNDGYYEATVPAGIYEKMIWCRMKPATTANNWNNKWNQTGDLTYDSSKNLFTVANDSWDGATTTWSKWTTKQPCCTTADFSVVSLGTVAVGCTPTATIEGNHKPTVKWSSSNTTVATINETTGVIRTIAAGETTITATTTDANGFCSGTTKTTKLTVKNPSVSVKANKTTPCAGEELTLTATVTDAGTGNTYQWYKGSDPISGAINTTYTINSVSTTDTGDYKVVVSGGILCSALTSDAKIVTVNELPSAPQFDAAPSYCAGDPIALPTKDNAKNTVTWYEEDGTTPAGTPLNTAGDHTYKAKATNANGCVSADYGTYSYTVKARASKANLTVSNNTYTYDGAVKAATVIWSDTRNSDGITITEPTNVKDVGSYTIKVTTTAHGELCASNGAITLDEKLTINKKTPEAADFVYTNQTVTYNGNAQTATVTWKDGYDNTGAITVLYEGKSTAPTNVGTYTISVTSASSDNFNATTSAIEKGTLTIRCAEITDVASNFELSKTSYNFGEEAKPTVSLKQSSTLIQAGLGTITTKYYNSSNEEVANPTAVGTYTAKISIAAGKGYCQLDETTVGTFTITCPTPAVVPTLSKTDVQRCNGVTGTKGTITITNYNSAYNGGDGYKFLLGDSFEPTIGNDGVMREIDFDGESETYKVQVAKVCGSSISEYVNSTIEVNAINTVPTISLDPTSAPVCEGATFANIADYVTVTTNGDRVGWYEQASGGDPLEESVAIKQTTYYAEANIGDCKSARAPFEVTSIMKAPKVPEISSSKNTICAGESVTITLVSREDGVTYTMNSSDVFIEDETYTTGALNETASFTLTATNSCGSTNSAGLTITVDKRPTFTAPTATQTNKEVTLTSAAGASTVWSVDPTGNVTLTNNGDGTATFVATANGDYTITASNGVCAQVSHTIKVSDAFYIWVRNAKESDTAYGQFYYPNENSEAVRGGEMFYAECDALPTKDNYKTYNEGGRPADIVQSDCDGYTWYGFKASEEVISGTKYFYVRATNDISNGGYYTHSVPLKVTISADLYYTLGETGNGYWGWNLATASAPYAGPMVHASGDAKFNANNFADFVSLYVTDCSGKEITAYQWYKDGVEYSSICNYSIVEKNKDTKVNEYKTVASDAGKTNNIRPNAAGNYTCKTTYKDGSSATSAAFEVTATSGTTYSNFNSDLPVIMVNTGSKDFPTCEGLSGTASKNADKMKKKLSVDVKILHAGEIVYDRKARMAYRGSSSLNFQKKSYAFCPGDANCGDKDKGEDYVKTAKLNMLGIGDACDKDWVLYAAAADPSMLRNRMVFETYQAMRPGDWGVHSRYVELIINGEYKGVYVMMDKITQNEKRVNVKWDVDDATKRGFILKFDKTDIADRSVDYPDGDEKTFLSKYSGKHDIGTYDTTNDQAFEIEYPEKGDIEDDGGNWYEVINFIKGKINDFETALSAGDYATVQQIIDYESWADWFILSEYTKNVDAFRASCVFVYDGNKIKATPLWDQELSFNNQSPHANRYTNDDGNKGCQSAIGLLIKNDKVYTDGFAAPFWFTGKLAGGKGTEKLAAKTFTGALLNDQCFVQMLKNRWKAHKEGALSNASLTALITEYEKELTEAVRTREANFWSSNGYSRNTLSCSWGDKSTGYYDDDYATAKGHITNWISDNNATTDGTGRRKGLDAAISALEGTGLDISISPASIETTPWVPVVVQVKNESGYEYTLTYTDRSLDQVKDLIIERSGDTYKYHIPRPAAWGTGNEAVEGERKDISYGIKATLQIGDANNQCGTSGELPSATATIILQDEDNDDCDKN